jgi:hypothetical protein
LKKILILFIFFEAMYRVKAEQSATTYLWLSNMFLESFPTIRGGGGIKVYQSDGVMYGATHVGQDPSHRPRFSDAKLIFKGKNVEFVKLLNVEDCSENLGQDSDITSLLSHFRALGCLV